MTKRRRRRDPHAADRIGLALVTRWGRQRQRHLSVCRGQFQPALGIKKKEPRHDDSLAGSQSFHDLHTVSVSGSGRDLARLEDSFAWADEDELALACIQDGVARDGEAVWFAHIEFHIHEHAGAEQHGCVIHFKLGAKRE